MARALHPGGPNAPRTADKRIRRSQTWTSPSSQRDSWQASPSACSSSASSLSAPTTVATTTRSSAARTGAPSSSPAGPLRTARCSRRPARPASSARAPHAGRQGRRKAALSLVAEEPLFELLQSALELVDDARNAGRHDLDLAGVAVQAELVAGLDRGLHRRAIRGHGEDDAILLL